MSTPDKASSAITPKIINYTGPAGGWGALKATNFILQEQDVFLKGSVALLKMNKRGGFDCPGCGWGTPKKTHPAEFCENGAKALAWEATGHRTTRAFFAEHSVSELHGWSDQALEAEGRLTEPMIYDAAMDHYVPIAWEQAFQKIGESLWALADPNEAEFYTSGRTSNEAAFLYQIFVREFGTNNFPDCSNFCHEPTSVGLPESIGIGKGTCHVEDFADADLIFIFGQNPGTNSPRMLTELHEASHRGVPIVAINPLRERSLERFQAPQDPIEMATFSSTRIATHYLQVKIGGDIAALKGIMKAVIALDDAAVAAGQPRVIDVDFIETHTQGLDALIADLRASEWADLESRSGLLRADLDVIAELYAKAKNVIAAWGMGITQHRNGTRSVQQITNLLLLRGNMGRKGAGVVPVRGHSNVQGNRTVGIWEKPPAKMLELIEQTFGFRPPQAHGHDVAAAIEAMLAGNAKAFIGLGGNFVGASPDTGRVGDAFRQLDLTVSIATKLNRTHTCPGKVALLLPCLAHSEIDIQNGVEQVTSVEDGMSMVTSSRGSLKPATAALRSEPWIVAGIAKATLPQTVVDWDALAADYALIRDKLEQVIPLFKHYNQRLRDEPAGWHLKNGARDREWSTPNGKANFLVFKGLGEELPVSEKGALWLTTIRSHDQFNTSVYSGNDRYRGVIGQRDILFINENEMGVRGLKFGDRIDIRTLSTDGIERVLKHVKVVPYLMPDGACATYFPEANGLIPIYNRDADAGTPAGKAIPVILQRSAA
jgi:formate dehydrogenase major subunit